MTARTPTPTREARIAAWTAQAEQCRSNGRDDLEDFCRYQAALLGYGGDPIDWEAES